MSNKERAKQNIDQLPEYKMTKILYLLKGIQLDDDLFCEKMLNDYLQEDSHEMISFEQALSESGVTLNDLRD